MVRHNRLEDVTLRARLIAVRVPVEPAGIVLVVHGGGSREDRPAVHPRQVAVLRTIPLARTIARVGTGHLAVFRMLNSTRGWNPDQSPVDDIAWALTQLEQRFGAELPIGLVGHSLGGRAVILAAGHKGVCSVAALAPWVYPSDGDNDLSGRTIMIIHGDSDKVADPIKSAAMAEGLRRTATVCYRTVEGGTHAMLRHRARFDGVAAQFMATTLSVAG